jgi:non-ribosomal peptide synthetase component F
MDILDVGIIKQKIVALRITHLTYSANYLNTLGTIAEPHYLRRIISGGESISAELAACWGNLLINAYGPTESTVICLMYLSS